MGISAAWVAIIVTLALDSRPGVAERLAILQERAGKLGGDGQQHLIVIDALARRLVQTRSFGLFFEEILHAGEGGLYAELIQDRSFEGLAFTQHFLEAKDKNLRLDSCTWHNAYTSSSLPYLNVWVKRSSAMEQSWFSLPNTKLYLSRKQPINPRNKVYMVLQGSNGSCGIINTGFWGIPAQRGAVFHLSLYLRTLSMDQQTQSAPTVTVALQSTDGLSTYAAATFHNISAEGNGLLGGSSPFRTDLLQLLKELRPGFLRFPGGCYVEGTLLKNAFYWKPSTGAVEERPGHWNGMWEYWSTDGLGLYEYMLLAEELQAEPIWVINNGVAHADSRATADIMGMVQDALDSVEFIMGPPDSQWGAKRAAMGHPQPWNLTYFAIGNEDCGKPYYLGNYVAFATALRLVYPHLRLIANCDMGDAAPQDLYDWHWYTDEDHMFAGRFIFDTLPRDQPVFASEYAVFDHGISTKPSGNLGGAIAEAGFMTGLERNSDVVQLAAFAPLLTNVNASVMEVAPCPTSLIIYDNHRAVRTPSYYVQQLFAANAGLQVVSTRVAQPEGLHGLAASTSCLDAACTQLACKVVNYAPVASTVRVDVRGLTKVLAVNTTTLTSRDFYDSNSLDHPDQVIPTSQVRPTSGNALNLELPAFSLTVLHITESHHEGLLGVELQQHGFSQLNDNKERSIQQPFWQATA